MRVEEIFRFEGAAMFVSPVLAADVDGCSLVIVLALFIELSSFRELLEETY